MQGEESGSWPAGTACATHNRICCNAIGRERGGGRQADRRRKAVSGSRAKARSGEVSLTPVDADAILRPLLAGVPGAARGSNDPGGHRSCG